jgi:chemotaxis protein methyltransferase CheR
MTHAGRREHGHSPTPTPLSDRVYRRLADLVRHRFGIHLTPAKRTQLVHRLHNQLLTLGLASHDAYLDHLEADADALDVLADLISTGHTFFFREQAHFDFLRTRVLPDLESRTRDLRLWCAAASTGEEAYSIAMTMLDHFGRRYARLDAGLLATDLSARALRHAAAGVYSAEQVRRVPEAFRRRWFRTHDSGGQVVAPQLRAEVLFRKFNLSAAQWSFRKPFHVIFCRNVMMYFDPPARRRLVAMLYDFTAPGGYLFVGHSERIDLDDAPFRSIQPAFYQRPELGVSP